MLINFNNIKAIRAPGMNGGTGEMTASVYADSSIKIIPCCIHKGGSIGNHIHNTSDDINYVISGTGKAICDDSEEILKAKTCHICPKGSRHSIINTGDEDLVLLTIVIEK